MGKQKQDVHLLGNKLFDGEFKEKESCVALDTDKEFNVQFAVEIKQ